LPRRQDVAYLRERIGYTFYSPATVTDALVHEIITVINNREAAMRIIHISRSAQKMNLKADLSKIIHPCGLIWGLNDNITPPMVAHEFRRGLSHAELYFIDRCGHAAMMEQPARFNELVLSFLNRFESTRIPNESGTKTVRI
jgi:pimeloyl-ACP methyl ester carboxylesterase